MSNGNIIELPGTGKFEEVLTEVLRGGYELLRAAFCMNLLRLLPVIFPVSFENSVKQPDNRFCRDVAEFLRLQFVKTSAINPPLT